jgi:hypothetical protein
MDTFTRTFCFSGLTSTTVPVKFAKGPSITRTVSVSSNETRGFGRRTLLSFDQFHDGIRRNQDVAKLRLQGMLTHAILQ